MNPQANVPEHILVQNPDDTLEIGTSEEHMENLELRRRIENTRNDVLNAIADSDSQMSELYEQYEINPSQGLLNRIQSVSQSTVGLQESADLLQRGINRLLITRETVFDSIGQPTQVPPISVVEVRTGLNLFRARRPRQVLGRTPTTRVRI